jgi:hypothetical protein
MDGFSLSLSLSPSAVAMVTVNCFLTVYCIRNEGPSNAALLLLQRFIYG